MTPTHTATLLIVDDTAENLAVLSELLQPDYTVRAANSGESALRIARSQPRPDLILLDVMMPVMDGYEVFRQLQADPDCCDIPVIFVTAMSGSVHELHGLSIGAMDYITKPIVPEIVLARVRTHVELKQARDRLKGQNEWLESEVARRMQENDITQLVAIRALAHLAETRDPETGNHILRTQAYVQALGMSLRDHPHFRAALNGRMVDLLTRSAPLHDIGKVGIPDAILQKPGPLTDAEWAIMKTHTTLGVTAIAEAERDIAQRVEFLALAKEIAGSHHEKWDGTGYPLGLAGDAIPVSARLMAVADVFDALISRRVYKPAFSYERARDLIVAGRGIQFDPDVVDAFAADFGTYIRIAETHCEDA